jgi:hypothetical protein
MFGIVALANVRWGEFDYATISADGSFLLARCPIVEDVPITIYDPGVLPVLIDILVCFDEIVGFVVFHALGVDVVAVKFNSHNDVFASSLRDDRKATGLFCVHSLFRVIIDTEVCILVFEARHWSERCQGRFLICGLQSLLYLFHSPFLHLVGFRKILCDICCRIPRNVVRFLLQITASKTFLVGKPCTAWRHQTSCAIEGRL